MVFLQCALFKLSGETLEQNFSPATFLNVSWCGTKVAPCMLYLKIVARQISLLDHPCQTLTHRKEGLEDGLHASCACWNVRDFTFMMCTYGLHLLFFQAATASTTREM